MARRNRRERPRGTRAPAARPAGRPRSALDRLPPAIGVPLQLFLPAIAALALVFVALRRVTLGVRPTYLGWSYARLAADPFHPAANNPVGHRILAPLISWAIGFRGQTILLTNMLFVLALLVMVFVWMRGRGHGILAAVLGVATMALSTPALTTLHYGGYPDALCYLLVFGAWWARSRPWASCLLFLLALLAHESAAFLTPWLALEMARHGEGGPRPAGPRWAGPVALAATVLVFLAIRLAMERAHPAVEYSARFYLAPLLRDPLHWFHESAPHRWLGVAAAFNLCWLFAFTAAAHLVTVGRRADAARLLLPIACALAQLFVAYDVTRLATLAFPAVLLGLEHLLATDAWRARTWAPALLIANFFVPQVNVAQSVIDRMGPK